MTTFRIDFETRSEANIKLGGFRYSEDETTDLLLCAIGRDDEPVVIWDRYADDSDNFEALCLLQECSISDGLVWAFNATGFEVPVSLHHWEKNFGCPMPALNRWRCSAALVRVAAVPASLEKAAEFFNLGFKKDKVGSSLIRIFSQPQKSRKAGEGQYWITPDMDRKVTVAGEKISTKEAWDLFRKYCIRDVEVERELHGKVKSLELSGDMLDAFLTDMLMNVRGIPINVEAVAAAEEMVESHKAKMTEEFIAITGVNPNQTRKVLAWLQEKGYPGKDLRSATVAAVLKENVDLEDEEDDSEDGEAGEFGDFTMTEDAANALRIRAAINFAALKKLPTMRKTACRDNCVHGAMFWHGAHTGRASGKLIQIQNFRRSTLGYDNDGVSLTYQVYDSICEGYADNESMEMLYGQSPLSCIASSIRHFIDPGPDKHFLSIDLSNIEARVMRWISNDDANLDNFRKGLDPYRVQAMGMFSVKYDEVSKDQRQQSKVAELSLGYGGGKAAFQAMAQNYGLKLPLEQIKEIVKSYRANNPKITGFWSDLQNAAISAIEKPGEWFTASRIKLGCRNKLGYKELLMKLPSGRTLHYPLPSTSPVYKRRDHLTQEWHTISPHRAYDSDGELLDGVWKTTQISYYGQTKGVNYGRVLTWGGSLAENAAQSVAADFLNNGTRHLEAAGYRNRFQVHDEAVCDYEPEKGQSPEEMERLMCTLPSWAEFFPLAGEAQKISYYTK